MSEKIPYTEIIERMKSDIDSIAEGAYQKGLSRGYKDGYEAGQHEATTLEYQQGLNDAWECARKLFSEMSDTEINLVFPQEWNNGGFKALMALHPQDAIDRIKAYEQQKADEIEVGDEVEAHSGKAIVFYASIDSEGNKFCRYWYPSEDRFDMDNTKNLKKTGLHFPQVAELIEIMKGKQSEQRSCSTCKYYDGSDVSKCSDCYIPKGYSMWEPKECAE